MNAIKLPRKAKKLYIKKHGKGNYLAIRILNELLHEEGRKNATKFPKQYNANKTRAISYY